ncbi:putative membrane protein [Bacteroides fragilis str. 2-F-2 |nr:putative membrane protein [Bacteroides fragilis str. 2-F-2 \
MHIEKMKNLLWLYPEALMWFWMMVTIENFFFKSFLLWALCT